MDKIAFYQEQIEKIALNAAKARMMAKEVGVMPEGNWKWALKKLRDSRGDLLKGKELADAKRKLGAMNNNAYQGLKKMDRKFAAGNRLGKPNGGTEIGGLIDDKGSIIKKYLGRKGTESVAHQNADIYNTKRMFHTHPAVNKNPKINNEKKYLGLIDDKMQQHADEYANSGLNINTNYGEVNYNRAKSKAKNDYLNARHDKNTVRENSNRFHGKRNAKLVDLSGKESNELLRETGGNKQKIKQFMKDTDKAIGKHNDTLNDVEKYVKSGGRDWNKVDKDLNEKAPEMLGALRKERIRNEFNNHGNYRSDDYAIELSRSKHRKGDVLHNILTPSQDLEGVHKVKTDGRVRQVYFDRAPRKSRQQDVDVMKKKIDDFNANTKSSGLNDKINNRTNIKPSTSPQPTTPPTPVQPTPQPAANKKKFGFGAKLGLGTAGAAGIAGVYGASKANQEKAASEMIDNMFNNYFML